jgi:arylformamidase
MTAVFLDYDQSGLDAAYDQTVWASNMETMLKGYASASAKTRERLGAPRRFRYGPTAVEELDVFRAPADKAPTLIFVHGGAWRRGAAADYAFPAETFVAAGVHYVALDFAAVTDVSGDLRVLASQVRRAVAWIHAHAHEFGGDCDWLYLAGHSSGAHLAAVALTTDWNAVGAPAQILKGGVLACGMYDLHPVRLSARSSYVAFDDDTEAKLSAIRHIDRLSAPLVVAWGTNESPEFIRQAREFAAAVKAAGKPVEALVADGCNHFEVMNTFATAEQLLGRAALNLIKANG